MIQTALNGMITILLSKFVLNDLPHAAGLAENGGFVRPLGVRYETPKDRTKIESAPGLLEFVGSIVQDLTRKYSTGPKSLRFVALEVDVLAVFVWGEVMVHTATADMWAADRELTKQALRYILSHEFGHYMMASGHVKIPLPKGPKWREARSEWSENYADEFAERETGMSREELDEITDTIGRKMLGEGG